MKNQLFYGLMLVLPLATHTGCSTDDSADDSANGGALAGRAGGQSGRGGQIGNGGSGGRAGSAGGLVIGSEAGESFGGTAGEGSNDTGGTSAEAGSAGAAGEAGSGAVALTDAEILKVVATANQGEIAAALVAKPSAHSASVTGFAQMMITDHSASNEALLALVSTKHIAPMASPLSERLDREAATALLMLSEASATTFDVTYMQSQVTMHQEVLTLLNARLIPNATDADLKALLVTTQATVSTHLQQATTIAAGL